MRKLLDMNVTLLTTLTRSRSEGNALDPPKPMTRSFDHFSFSFLISNSLFWFISNVILCFPSHSHFTSECLLPSGYFLLSIDVNFSSSISVHDTVFVEN